jgi:Protein of unknown function (DUF2934)
MTPKPKSREPRSRKPKPVSNLEEKIRLRAYEFYERRGRIDGFALEDWLQAEEEIRRAPKSGSKSKRNQRRTE